MPLLLLLLACAPADPAQPAAVDPVVACGAGPDVTWDAWGHGFFLTYCNACHSSSTPDRRGAPEGLDFDSQAAVRANAAAIRAAVIDQATMPVGGGLDHDELRLLDRMLACSP